MSLPRRLTSLLRPRNTLLRPRPRSLLSPSASASRSASSSSFLQDQPSPPRLPADQQAEFERLQRAAEAALSSHNTVQIPADAPLSASRHVSTPASTSAPTSAQAQAQRTEKDEVDVSPGSLSAGMRKGAPPEFEGEKNPKTGEVGGPKNEPLRWGSKGDWSYNGRVTDF